MLTQSQRLRQRGPMPKLSDSEVLTMEMVGSYLGISQDEALFAFFQEHYTHFFPRLDWRGCIARPLCDKRPTCGESKRVCG